MHHKPGTRKYFFNLFSFSPVSAHQITSRNPVTLLVILHRQSRTLKDHDGQRVAGKQRVGVPVAYAFNPGSLSGSLWLEAGSLWLAFGS
jgi:hypothetical protein